MPRNNSSARKQQRRETVSGSAERRRQRRADAQQQGDRNYLAVLSATADIVNTEGHRLNFDETIQQRTHQCDTPEHCTLTARACSALNQNMPGDKIIGQDGD